MGPFITPHRERILDHDEPTTTCQHIAVEWDYGNSPIECSTCGWSTYPFTGQRALRMWRVHRAAAREERWDH